MDSQSIDQILSGKNILITGGTGSFGHQILKSLLDYSPNSITVFSRDEKKQYDMGKTFSQHKHIHFKLGDVRDFERTREVCRDINIIFHAAAMKQVPNSEIAPFEAVKTNVIGAENVRRAAIESGVETVIAISTDKAVKPVNVMGMSKSLQERIMLSSPTERSVTKFVCVRYGNVLGSRGSVIPLFKQQVLENKPITITHPGMTRFLLTLPEAVELVLWATVKGENGDLWVRKMPAANILDLGKTVAFGITGHEDYPHQVVGTRAGEKMHEVLVSEEEMWRADEFEQHYRIPAWIQNEQKNSSAFSAIPEYASNTDPLLSREDLFAMLSQDGWFDEAVSKPLLRNAA